MKCFAVISLVVILVYSCRDKKVNTYENNLGVVPAHLAQVDTINYTVIQFPDSIKDFGTVKSGEAVVLKYKFRNAGKTVLFISNVQPACGCTVANYPKNPIMPDEGGIITATFNTKGHPGFINKTITVTTNTSNGIKHILVLRGQVKDSL